jgi:L-histidine N-alpha-methyltransferase
VSTVVAEYRGLQEPALAQAIREALSATPRRLPFECFYDDLGSALFDAITCLPEYGLTRAELRLLHRHAAEVARRLPSPLEVVELGSGSGRKTRVLLDALTRRGPVVYRPVDIAGAALDACRREMSGLSGLVIAPLQQSHLEGLEAAVAMRDPRATVLVLFLGSNLGNFEPAEAARFLRGIRRNLRAGDAALVTADLEKAEGLLLAAYDDPLGLTAAFNRNALARLNRELGADFALRAFRHRALYAAAHRRVEMHLVAQSAQTVHLAALDFTLRLERGESIWTESSHKFAPGELSALGRDAGFENAALWQDLEWPFAQALWLAAPLP